MKITYLAALLLGATLTANAQGYKDGIEYYKAGQFDNAITILNKNLTAADTDQALANYYLGQAYLAKDDKAKARAAFDAGLAANPQCPNNYVGLGALDLLDGNEKAAEENFKKATGLAKKNNEIIVDIARAYYNADPVKYDKQIEERIKKAHKNSKDREPSIYIFEGDRLKDKHDYDGAAGAYNQAIYYDEDSPEAYVKYANVYFGVVPQYAVGKLEELLKKQPNSALAQRELAEKYYDNGQLTKAAAQYGVYMANPNHFPQDKARYAVLLFADKKYEEAINVAREVAAQTPEDVTLQRIIYRSLNELNRVDEAVVAAESFFTNPVFAGKQNAGDYRAYADILVSNQQDSLAVVILQQGRIAHSKDASIALDLSSKLSKMEKASEAADTYADYLTLTENPTENDYNIGSIFYLDAAIANKDNEAQRQKYAAEGVALIQKMLDPENPRATHLLRIVQLELNGNGGIMNENSEIAIKNLIAALDKDPSQADPANASNNLQLYCMLYNQLVNYYDRTENADAATSAREMLQKYTDLRNQN